MRAFSSSAYNAGGTSTSFATPRQDSLAAETLQNYKAFLRESFADGRGTPDAKTYGLEVELGWRPNARLSVRTSLGLLRTKVLRTVLAADTFRARAFQRAPNLSATVAIDWRPLDRLQLSAQVRRNSGYFSDDANSPSRRIDGSTIVNARAAWTVGATTLSGYVRNVLDEFYLTYLFTPTFGTAGDPREFGLALETRF